MALPILAVDRVEIFGDGGTLPRRNRVSSRLSQLLYVEIKPVLLVATARLKDGPLMIAKTQVFFNAAMLLLCTRHVYTG